MANVIFAQQVIDARPLLPKNNVQVALTVRWGLQIVPHAQLDTTALMSLIRPKPVHKAKCHQKIN